MRSRLTGWLVLVAVGCGSSGTTTSPDAGAGATDGAAMDAAAPAEVPRYGIFELDLPFSGADTATASAMVSSPDARSIPVDGFLVRPGLWRVRFSPDVLGDWQVSATVSDGSSEKTVSARFVAVASSLPGFVSPATDNPTRWVTATGEPFPMLGLGDCVVTMSGDPESVYKYWGFDGPQCGPGECAEARTDIDTYLSAYAEAGFNTFRFGVDNCAFDLKTEGGGFGVEEGDWGDRLVAKLRAHGYHIVLTLYGFGIRPPADVETAKRYARYVVARYGAAIDVWELTNEFPNPPETVTDAWYTQLAAYIRSIDPYRHRITTSWQRPDLPAIEVNAPHWYSGESEYESDTVTAETIDLLRHQQNSREMPMVFGEQGNTGVNWSPASALRMRIRSYTAFFREASFIFWNQSSNKAYCAGDCTNPAANIYLGPEERGYTKVLQDFVRDVETAARPIAVTVSAPDRVRAYALRGPRTYVAYLHAYTDHASPTTGVTLTVDPLVAGTATWISPATGAVLGTQAVGVGAHAIPVPAFTTDVALKVR